VGAKAVQIGTANFINPRATLDVIEGIKNYLAVDKIKDINEIIGTFKP
jgi:dihydroorotate dehydrogenase (NAD+) catalytic subunit